MKTIAFDLDDTLCTRPCNVETLGIEKYLYCTPIQRNIDIMNDLYNAGHYIIIYTARGMKSLDGNIELIYKDLYDITRKSLECWGAKYHEIKMGKIYYDLLIDDKVLNVEDISKIVNIFSSEGFTR